MLVKDIMIDQVVAIEPDMPIADVNSLMEQRKIRHFPILKDADLVGIVSDRDISLVGSQHPNALEGVSLEDAVSKIMTTSVITAHPLDAIEEAAKVLREHKIGAMPVIEGSKLVGIVTAIDFLDALISMTGVHTSTSRLELELSNRPGSLAALLIDIAAKHINVSSVMTERLDETCICFSLRVNTINPRGLADDLRAKGYTVLWPIRKA